MLSACPSDALRRSVARRSRALSTNGPAPKRTAPNTALAPKPARWRLRSTRVWARAAQQAARAVVRRALRRLARRLVRRLALWLSRQMSRRPALRFLQRPVRQLRMAQAHSLPPKRPDPPTPPKPPQPAAGHPDDSEPTGTQTRRQPRHTPPQNPRIPP